MVILEHNDLPSRSPIDIIHNAPDCHKVELDISGSGVGAEQAEPGTFDFGVVLGLGVEAERAVAGVGGKLGETGCVGAAGWQSDGQDAVERAEQVDFDGGEVVDAHHLVGSGGVQAGDVPVEERMDAVGGAVVGGEE